MKRVCLAYDGSSSAEVALENLAYAGLPEQLEASVISVADVWLPPDAASVDDATAPPAVRKARAQAQAAVDAYRSLAGRAAARLRVLFPKWKVEEFAYGDSPSWGVVKHAENWRADLIVLGSHSHSPLERFFLGSVSQKALGEAPCSVRRSSVTDFLLRPSTAQNSEYPSTYGPIVRMKSPCPGSSTLMTSAPRSASSVAAKGAPMRVPRSRRRRPASGPGVDGAFTAPGIAGSAVRSQALCAPQRERGKPSTRSARMLRWISDVPAKIDAAR